MRHIRGKEIGFIFQDPLTSLNPTLTIGYQIAESIRQNMGLSKQAATDRVVELLEQGRHPSREGSARRDYPHQFSGGMRQRVMIAIALSCDPKLILADEPTTALDVTIQAQILELIQRLSDEFHTAVLLITHDLGIAAGMCDRSTSCTPAGWWRQGRWTNCSSSRACPTHGASSTRSRGWTTCEATGSGRSRVFRHS